MRWNIFFIQGRHRRPLNIWQKVREEIDSLSFVRVLWMIPLLHLQEERVR